MFVRIWATHLKRIDLLVILFAQGELPGCLLMAEFSTATIQLNLIAERYLGMKPATASKKAGAGDLLIPSFRMNDSQKAPRIVHVSDLAMYIDSEREKARKELKYIQTEK